MTKKITLTKTLNQLEIWIGDLQGDLSSGWLSEQDQREMQQQLQNLIIAKSNLELVMNRGEQIFNSVINK